MQTYQIPETDNDFHIVIKRPQELPPSVMEQFVTRDMFMQFTQTMTTSMHKIVQRMTNIEDLLQTIATQEVFLESSPQQSGAVQVVQEEDEPMIEVRQEMVEDPFDEETQEHKIQIIEENEEEVELHIEDPAEMFVQEVRTRSRRQAPPPAKKIKIERISMKKDDQRMTYCEVESSREETVETIAEEFDIAQDVKNIAVDCTFEGVAIPVQSLDDLKALNSILENDETQLAQFKIKMHDVTQKSEHNFQRALSMLISDRVLFELNWQGFKGKHKMQNMFLFQRLIFDEWFTHIEYDEYINQLKIITKKAHKRYAKNQERRRQRESMRASVGIQERDQISEAIKTIVVKEVPSKEHKWKIEKS